MSKDSEPIEGAVASADAVSAEGPADEESQDTTADKSAEPAAVPESAPQTDLQEKQDLAAESPVEPMPPAPTPPDPEVQPQAARPDASRAGHGRQPSLSIQSKMRSSSFRNTSVSQGLVSPSTVLKSPQQSLPPLTGDGESVHEVFRKQSTRIEELERENKRLEKDFSDAITRWRKTEDQLEDLREASVDGAELREKLKLAEEKVASIELLVCGYSHLISTNLTS